MEKISQEMEWEAMSDKTQKELMEEWVRMAIDGMMNAIRETESRKGCEHCNDDEENYKCRVMKVKPFTLKEYYKFTCKQCGQEYIVEAKRIDCILVHTGGDSVEHKMRCDCPRCGNVNLVSCL